MPIEISRETLLIALIISETFIVGYCIYLWICKKRKTAIKIRFITYVYIIIILAVIAYQYGFHKGIKVAVSVVALLGVHIVIEIVLWFVRIQRAPFYFTKIAVIPYFILISAVESTVFYNALKGIPIKEQVRTDDPDKTPSYVSPLTIPLVEDVMTWPVRIKFYTKYIKQHGSWTESGVFHDNRHYLNTVWIHEEYPNTSIKNPINDALDWYRSKYPVFMKYNYRAYPDYKEKSGPEEYDDDIEVTTRITNDPERNEEHIKADTIMKDFIMKMNSEANRNDIYAVHIKIHMFLEYCPEDHDGCPKEHKNFPDANKVEFFLNDLKSRGEDKELIEKLRKYNKRRDEYIMSQIDR